MQKLMVTLGLVSVVMVGCASVPTTDFDEFARDPDCKVNEGMSRNAIPKTPNNMSLPSFGQGIIGWGTGPNDAKKRFENVQKSDLKTFQEKGVTLDMLKEWQAFYENETLRNPCNPTAPYRAKLMGKIIGFWVE